MPPELPERERLRQILIWSAQTNIEKPSFSNQTYKSRDEQSAKETGKQRDFCFLVAIIILIIRTHEAYLIKKEIVRKLTDKAIEVSLLAYPQVRYKRNVRVLKVDMTKKPIEAK